MSKEFLFMDEYPIDDYDYDAMAERQAEEQEGHWRETGRCPSCGDRGKRLAARDCVDRFHNPNQPVDTPVPQRRVDTY